MKTGRSLQELAVELERRARSIRDLVVPGSQMTYLTEPDSGLSKLAIAEGMGKGHVQYGLTNLARKQLAEKLGIPHAYFERMRTQQPGLLDDNVNTWLHAPDADARMVRTMDGNVRALLSTKYRRIDNYAVFEAVYPVLKDLPGADIVSLELTEQRMYLKAVSTRTTFEVQKDDIVQAGVVISNSEVGCGGVRVQPLVYRLVCTNGLISETGGMVRAHLGKHITADDANFALFRDDTVEADDRALMLKVRDVVHSAVSQATLDLLGGKLRASLGIPITGDPVKSVQVLASRFDLRQEEQDGVLRALIKGADMSAFGLVNAVTAFSQEVPDYDRATEFEAMGGKLLDFSAPEWKGVVAA